MTFITTLLKKTLMLNCCLLTETALPMKSNQKMFIKIFLNTNFYLTLAVFQKTKFYDNQNEMVVSKIKHKYKGIPINKFMGFKSKMNWILLDEGEQSSAAKGVNIATEFNEFKDTLFNKKVVRHKMKENSKVKT